jgi:glutamyl-tRNA synthetase
MVDKKWSPKSEGQISLLKEYFKNNHFEDSKDAEERTKAFLQENGIGMGEIFPILRLALTGTLKGPDLFQTITILGKPKVIERLEKLLLRMKSS